MGTLTDIVVWCMFNEDGTLGQLFDNEEAARTSCADRPDKRVEAWRVCRD